MTSSPTRSLRIPAIPFFLLIKTYARQTGLSFFTLKDQRTAIDHFFQEIKQLKAA